MPGTSGLHKPYRVLWRSELTGLDTTLGRFKTLEEALYELGSDRGYYRRLDEEWSGSTPRSWLEEFQASTGQWEVRKLDFTE